MQTTDDAGKHQKSKGDEDAINFRPSSNFKYMKKYCKGKVEASSGSSASMGAGEAAGAVQPPLPREPPPASPPALVTPKREPREEDEPAEDGGVERVMCRQFARGTCTRGAACIYAHEIILSQLPGIYTFCRDFQNATCSFPRCKFVHATVFEKEYFYRTGFLPPHATDHLKEPEPPSSAHAPHAPHAPHAHPPHPEGGQAEAPAAFSAPAPAALAHVGGGEAPAPGALAAAAGAPLALKRDYDDLGAAASREAARPEAAARAKCSSCDLLEFRRQCQRNKAEKLARSLQELEKKTALLNKRNSRQLDVLIAVLKHHGVAKPGSAPFSSVHLRSDKEKAMVDKLSLMIAADGGLAAALHDRSNKALASKLARLLRGEEAPPPAPADS